MKTNRTLLVVAAFWLTAAATTFAASAQMGTWKLNEAKSKFGPDATKNKTVTYAAAEGGMTKVTVDGTDKDGKAVHWTTTVKFDGKPYKVEGDPVADEVVYKSVSSQTNEITLMKDGKVVASGKITVSKDGKSRVVTISAKGADGKKMSEKAYYDKE
ncbi:MAG TPA: hypothetical protein VGF73_09030 [Chthoniobacterales bacterium]